MSVLDKLRDKWAEDIATLGRAGHQNGPAVRQIEKMLRDLDSFEAGHPGLEDHTNRCVVCGGPVALSGSTLVCTTDYGRTIGWQHSGCVGKPACAKVTP